MIDRLIGSKKSAAVGRRIILTALLVAIALGSATVHAFQAAPALKTVLKLASVVAAAKFAEEASVSLNEYWADAAPAGDSIYSVSFSFDRTSWTDFWSKPDVFLVVECEGARRFVVPEIEYDWNYGTKIYTFRCPTLPKDSRCVLRLYDDDSASDKIWKSVLSTRITWNADARATAKAGIPMMPATGLACIEAKTAANGKLELLTQDEAQSLVLDAPDLIALAELTVPKAKPADKWEMKGEFINSGKEMGKVHLTHWWSATRAAKPLLPSKVALWGVLLVGLLIVVVWGVGKRRSNLQQSMDK